MKLNTDCVRSVMLKIEESHCFSPTADGLIANNPLQIEDLYDSLPKFTHEDIFYSLFNLEQAGYIASGVTSAAIAAYLENNPL